jgi:hypothetical protein
MLTDRERLARWKVQGEAQLDAHRRCKAHRRRPASSVDGGSAAAGTKRTEA